MEHTKNKKPELTAAEQKQNAVNEQLTQLFDTFSGEEMSAYLQELFALAHGSKDYEQTSVFDRQSFFIILLQLQQALPALNALIKK